MTDLDCYLGEIDRTPLLTGPEELDLADRIAAGDAAARDQLARANLRLVVRLARDYAGRGLGLDDLIAEGNLGLMRAVEAFDPAAGCRFSTYAAYWVKQSIRAALTKSGHAVRLPQYMGTLVRKWRQAEGALRDERGAAPTPPEVAGRLGLSARQMTAVGRALKAVASGRAAGGDDVDPGDVATECREAAPDDRLTRAEDIRAAVGSLARLGEREATVLRLRFGLGGGEPATCRQVGQHLGLTRERVRQLERDALVTLRGHLGM